MENFIFVQLFVLMQKNLKCIIIQSEECKKEESGKVSNVHHIKEFEK